MQQDLFASPPSAGPPLLRDIVTEEEERALIASFASIALHRFRFQQWEGNRRAATFGWQYDFGNGAFEPIDPIPGFLLPLRRQAAVFAGLDPDALVQAHLILYDPGAGIGWHRDRKEFEQVIGISLGAPTTMRFRRRLADGRFERRTALLPPRSAYLLADELRHAWEHSIAPMKERRWSITFRSLSEYGKAKAR